MRHLDAKSLEGLARRDAVLVAPTFMLGEWPFGGIQQDDTMRMVLARFARKARERGLS